MKTLIILTLIVSATAVQSQHSGSGHNSGSTITCSSRKSHRKTCYADTSGGVQLIRQISRASCHDNWGYTHNQIWVDNGCRATFQLNSNSGSHNTGGYNSGGHNSSNNYDNHNNSRNNNHNNNQGGHNNQRGYNNQGHGNRLVCESINYNRSNCAISHGANVSFSQQLSSASCEHNWGYTQEYVWVSNGCRAEFIINTNGH